jgi:hypothetical protein
MFKETQRFNQWWHYLLFSLTFIPILYSLYRCWEIKEYKGFFITMGLMLVVLLFIFSMRLDTEIKEEGIYVQFFPFHLRRRFYPKDSIQEIFVREYKPILEYGGYGIRYSFPGKAYNIQGKWGLQLVFKDGRKLLIGTQKVEELEDILKRWKESAS